MPFCSPARASSASRARCRPSGVASGPSSSQGAMPASSRPTASRCATCRRSAVPVADSSIGIVCFSVPAASAESTGFGQLEQDAAATPRDAPATAAERSPRGRIRSGASHRRRHRPIGAAAPSTARRFTNSRRRCIASPLVNLLSARTILLPLTPRAPVARPVPTRPHPRHGHLHRPATLRAAAFRTDPGRDDVVHVALRDRRARAVRAAVLLRLHGEGLRLDARPGHVGQRAEQADRRTAVRLRRRMVRRPLRPAAADDRRHPDGRHAR